MSLRDDIRKLEGKRAEELSEIKSAPFEVKPPIKPTRIKTEYQLAIDEKELLETEGIGRLMMEAYLVLRDRYGSFVTFNEGIKKVGSPEKDHYVYEIKGQHKGGYVRLRGYLDRYEQRTDGYLLGGLILEPVESDRHIYIPVNSPDFPVEVQAKLAVLIAYNYCMKTREEMEEINKPGRPREEITLY